MQTRTEALRAWLGGAWLGPRGARFLIAVLLVFKLAVLAWNAAVFDGRTYDQSHHQDRALFGGLRPGKMAYNPPLYYLPALLVHRPSDVPLVERSTKSEGDDEEAKSSREAAGQPMSRSEREHKAKQLELLRWTNVFYVAFTYLGWIGFAFPRLLGSTRAWFPASLFLLTIPGFQKLGCMVHPDNAFAAFVTLGVCAWLFVRDRHQRGALRFWHLLGFAVAAGLVGLTRPFSIVPVFVLTLALLLYLFHLEGTRWLRLLPRAVLLLAIVGTLSGTWYVMRWRHSGQVTNAYKDNYIAVFEKRRADFDYLKYFRSFHLMALLETPNRKFAGGTVSIYDNNAEANSFFTLAYSEVWGDHWLYFSGRQSKETKLWPKRAMLAGALLTPPLVLFLGGVFFADLWRRGRESWAAARTSAVPTRLRKLVEALELDLVPLAIAVLGGALYLYWQTGPALLPGKNSTVKFIYVAALVGPTLTILFRRRLPAATFNLVSAYLLFLFALSVPVVMFWPT